jgi:hypothetical protein
VALVANYQDGTITPLDLPAMAPLAPVAAGPEPDAVVIGPDSTTALVADFESGAVTPVDLVRLTAEPPISVAGNPTDIAIWRSSTVAYVSGGDNVTPVDLIRHRAGAPLSVGTTAQALALSDHGRTAWVGGGNGTLVSLKLASGAVGVRVAVGGQPTVVVIPVPPNTGTSSGVGR